jgi:hypothetical protein
MQHSEAQKSAYIDGERIRRFEFYRQVYLYSVYERLSIIFSFLWSAPTHGRTEVNTASAERGAVGVYNIYINTFRLQIFTRRVCYRYHIHLRMRTLKAARINAPY